MNLQDAINLMDGIFTEIAVLHELTNDDGLQGLSDSIVYAASATSPLTRLERAEEINSDLHEQGYADLSDEAVIAVVTALSYRMA